MVSRPLVATCCGGSALETPSCGGSAFEAPSCGGSTLLLFEPWPPYPRLVPCSEPWPF
jgi:hypothetical protein